MPTLEERIVEHLRTKGASLDDGELAEALGVQRPVIAETCRQLEARGLVVRNMAGGTRTVPQAAAPAAPRAAAPAAPPVAPDPPPPAPSASPVGPGPRRAAPAEPVVEPTFADHARRVLSGRWGTTLRRGLAALPGGDSHPFEFVSGNGRIVGGVVWLAPRKSYQAQSAAIAEAVLIVGHVTGADRRFLVFGEEWDAVTRWLTRYRSLLDGVELWFLDGERLERLA